MATATLTRDIGDFIGTACRWAAFDARGVPRAVVQARQATGDFTAVAALTVRRHPLTAVGAAVLAGLVVG